MHTFFKNVPMQVDSVYILRISVRNLVFLAVIMQFTANKVRYATNHMTEVGLIEKIPYRTG